MASDLVRRLAKKASEVDFTSYQEGEDSTRLTEESAELIVKAILAELAAIGEE